MDTLRNIVKRTYAGMCAVEAALSAVCLITTVVVIFSLAVFRSFDIPIHWALDTALLVFTWGVFLGADVAFREDKLVNVDFVYTRAAGKTEDSCFLCFFIF